MSKFGTVLGVLCGTLGAATTAAGGIYAKDNADILKDYVKGNETYTSQEMKDVKVGYEEKIEAVESQKLEFVNENGQLKIKVDGLQTDLDMTINGVLKFSDSVLDDLLGSITTLNLTNGYLIICRTAPYNVYYLDKTQLTLELIEQPKEGYCYYRCQPVSSGFYCNYDGQSAGAWRFDETTKKIVVISEKYTGGYVDARTATLNDGSKVYIYGKASSSSYSILVHNGKFYATDSVDGDSGRYTNTTVSAQNSSGFVVYNTMISYFVGYDGTVKKIADGQVGESAGDYFYKSSTDGTTVYDVNNSTSEFLEGFVTHGRCGGVLFSEVSSTDDAGTTTYSLVLYDIENKLSHEVVIPDSFYYSNDCVYFNHFLIGISSGESKGTYAISLDAFDLIKLSDTYISTSYLKTPIFVNEQGVVWSLSSYYSTYYLSSSMVFTAVEVDSTRYNYVNNVGKYVVLKDAINNGRLRVLNIETLELTNPIEGYDDVRAVASKGDYAVGLAYTYDEETSEYSSDVVCKNLVTGEQLVLASLPNSTHFTYSLCDTIESERFIVYGFKYDSSDSDAYCSVVYDKVKCEFIALDRNKCYMVYEFDDFAIFRSSITSYLYDFTSGEKTAFSGGVYASQIGDMYIFSRYGIGAQVYIPGDGLYDHVEIASCYDVEDMKIYKENDSKIVVYNDAQVLVIDKVNKMVVDSFLVTDYVEKTGVFKYKVVSDTSVCLAFMYTFNEDTFAFDRSMVF